ncbi:hypothetical protein ACFOSV_12705 [Algoriphagus namhaensis]|uniref:Restriction endonuclease type II NgoFVII C-terminal B3-like DNA-binding domain-containing protein n=1 Tax=Algoriphagus namhaensis TaxID=915353 RepID=A0ABV8AVT0_9BACT
MSLFAKIDLEKNGNYIRLIKAVAKLSGLFSESDIPYINYRVAENIFCKSFNAENLSRSDTAFDAKFNGRGVGLKTFTCKSGSSSEKIAEFNSLSNELRNYSGKRLAEKLCEYRNQRIKVAKRTYELDNDLYHIVARQPGSISLFEDSYKEIDVSRIKDVQHKPTGLSFNDEINFYNFNYSKSTLFRKFQIPTDAITFEVDVLDDPFELLLNFLPEMAKVEDKPKIARGINYVILPLYGKSRGSKFVFEKSGLNQWNAGGRERDLDEIYIPIPIEIHRQFPGFFPNRDQTFNLYTPTGDELVAKVCQENSKALMTNPNKALSDWLLRTILELEYGELATIEKLEILGFDSVIITKKNDEDYSIDIAKFDAYEQFISNPNFNIDDF